MTMDIMIATMLSSWRICVKYIRQQTDNNREWWNKYQIADGCPLACSASDPLSFPFFNGNQTDDKIDDCRNADKQDS